MRVSEIRVKRIRVNQGLGVHEIFMVIRHLRGVAWLKAIR